MFPMVAVGLIVHAKPRALQSTKSGSELWYRFGGRLTFCLFIDIFGNPSQFKPNTP
jgi:hypothetical protein